jgi:hypothetical protein
MSKYILVLLFVTVSFVACNNPNEKEINEINALIAKATETENSLLSIDTSKVFGTKRQLEADIESFSEIGDTLSKAEAFKVSDIFGSKKKFYRLTAGYPKFIEQIETSKKQLNDLKQDLENGLINKDNYSTYYSDEQIALKDLDLQINKLVIGIDIVVEKYEKDRPELLNLIEKLKQKSAVNE